MINAILTLKVLGAFRKPMKLIWSHDKLYISEEGEPMWGNPPSSLKPRLMYGFKFGSLLACESNNIDTFRYR